MEVWSGLIIEKKEKNLYEVYKDIVYSFFQSSPSLAGVNGKGVLTYDYQG
jgi:hypothetical protein